MTVSTQVQHRCHRGAGFEAVVVLHQVIPAWKSKRVDDQDARSLQPMGEVRTQSIIADQNDTTSCEEARRDRGLQPRVGYRTRADHGDADTQDLKNERTA